MPRPVMPRPAAARRSVLWIGGAAVLELGIARTALACWADVIDVATPPEAAALAEAGLAAPVFAVLAADRPGRFSLADAVVVSRAWPLVPLLSVASSLGDGRRRSGPALPGVEEIPWHDLAARGRWWLAALAAGLPTPLGTPATARREERVVDAVAGCLRGGTRAAAIGPSVAVAADGEEAVEGLASLLAGAGFPVTSRFAGRPAVDLRADVLVWDAGDLAADRIEWVRLLAANRPGLPIVLVDGFPRGDVVLEALAAGATAVLGRPVVLEALLGALLPRP
jgi:CheY-like chemotaxis protein